MSGRDIFLADIFKSNFSAEDFQGEGMKLRINVGVEWGKIIQGKKRLHKGYRPMRRVLQVIMVNQFVFEGGISFFIFEISFNCKLACF